ncbi:sulfatase/phosphatase domain-containing protein [Saccharicrinis sp. 156]|uniref:sulfatase/phosphatase domain-containing protein n=1 Tax=Saccharicrinis sp. 156 TaxID=3417574 RepID=UPI003D3395F4
MDVYLQDIMPSTLDLAGIDKPKYIEFNSLMKMARGKQKESPYSAIYGCYTKQQRMIRKDGFKLIAYPEAKKVLFYDLKKDPQEMNDLADEKEYQTKVKQLFIQLVKLQKEMDDELDLSGVYPELMQLSDIKHEWRYVQSGSIALNIDPDSINLSSNFLNLVGLTLDLTKGIARVIGSGKTQE